LLKQEKIEGLYPSIIHVALSASVSVSVSVSRLEYLSACC
jgi:hypothetical protein